MSRDLERELETMAKFAGVVYSIADAAVPDHLTWQVRFYDDPLHATPAPVVELRITRGAQGRRIVWTGEFARNEHESRWEWAIRRGIDSLRDDLRV